MIDLKRRELRHFETRASVREANPALSFGV
jgi:hypothetical protein